MDDDQLRDALIGTATEAEQAKVEAQARARAEHEAQQQDLHDLDIAPAHSDDEIVGRPKQVGDRAKLWILGTSFLVLSGLVAMTLYVLLAYGPDLLTVVPMAVLCLVLYGLINAAIYQGKDPLAALREIDAKTAKHDRERREARERRRAGRDSGDSDRPASGS